jgi:carboxylesterase type B
VRTKAGVPVWRYRYFGEWPNLELYPGSGAYHGADLHMIFGGAEDVTGLPNTQEQIRTMEYMMRAWASFVNDPAQGLTDVMNWPVYDPKGNMLVRLGYKRNARASFVSPNEFDNACPSNGSVAEAQGAF